MPNKNVTLCRWEPYTICKGSEYTRNKCYRKYLPECELKVSNPLLEVEKKKTVITDPQYLTSYPIEKYFTIKKNKIWWSMVWLIKLEEKKNPIMSIRFVRYKRDKRARRGWFLKSSFNITFPIDWVFLRDQIDDQMLPEWELFFEAREKYRFITTLRGHGSDLNNSNDT